jgi:hypothetical protein
VPGTQLPSPGARRPRAPRRTAAFAASLVLLLALAACGGGGDDDDDDAQPATSRATDDDGGSGSGSGSGDDDDATTATTADATTTSTAPAPVVTLRVVQAGPVSPYDDATLDPATQQAIVDVATAYVQRASADPLYGGAAPTGLDALFEPAALAQALGPDAAALVDRGAAPATGGVAVEAADCSVTVLIGLMGVAEVATADLHVVLAATTEAGVVRVERNGALTLVPTDGAWRIAGYDFTVARSGPGVTDASASATATTAGATATTAVATTTGEAG